MGEETNEDTFTQEDINEIVKRRLARERKKHDKEFEELKEQMEELQEEVDPPEHDKLKERFNSMNDPAWAKEATKRYEVKLAAIKAGVRKDAINDFAEFVDVSELEYEDGEVKGVDSLMERVKRKKPFYFGTDEEEDEDSVPGAGGSDFSGEGESNYYTKRQVEAMSQEEIDANLDHIEDSMERW